MWSDVSHVTARNVEQTHVRIRRASRPLANTAKQAFSDVSNQLEYFSTWDLLHHIVINVQVHREYQEYSQIRGVSFYILHGAR